MSHDIPTRRAPAAMRLPVPRHVAAASLVMGIGTVVLGIGYATTKVLRAPALEAKSVVAAIEVPLGWVMVAVGAWVTVAAIVGHGRASAHAIAAVVHGAYLLALVITFVIAYPLQPVQGVALALFGFIAHGGACLDYWQRGWR